LGLVDRIEDLLMSRYGRKDLSQLLEDSILSMTVLCGSEPVGIACFSYPLPTVYYSYRQLLLTFYAADTQHSNEAAHLTFWMVFESQAGIDFILTPIAETSPLESVLVPFFVEDPPWAKCLRQTVLPSLVVRAAWVEEYDDLMPLFETEELDLLQEYGKFFVSDLTKSSDTKCLVAEGSEGLAIGFVGRGVAGFQSG
jgi:hypothetical protein